MKRSTLVLFLLPAALLGFLLCRHWYAQRARLTNPKESLERSAFAAATDYVAQAYVADGYAKDAEAEGVSQPIRFHFIPDKREASSSGVIVPDWSDGSLYIATGEMRFRDGGVIGLIDGLRGRSDDFPISGGHFDVRLRHEPDGKWTILSATLGEMSLAWPAFHHGSHPLDRREPETQEK